MELGPILEAAAQARPVLRRDAPTVRAAWLEAVAAALDAGSAELVEPAARRAPPRPAPGRRPDRTGA